MFSLAILEDETAAVERLQACLDKFSTDHPGTQFETTVFCEPTSFLDGYKPVWDIVFMDIKMPHMDGMEAAHRLRKLDARVILIFLTSLAQFASKGYEVDALDYIIKPFVYPDFERKLERAIRLCSSDADYIVVAARSRTWRLALRDISYVEIHGHNLAYHTDQGTIEAYGTLRNCEEHLAGRGFLRCGKPYLVNARHITAVQTTTVTLTTNVELPIGRAFRKPFMEALADYFGNDHVR